MKFQKCILINFERTHGRIDGWTHEQAESKMPLQLFESWGDILITKYHYGKKNAKGTVIVFEIS